jgi:OOP family OmpA-OmpF porin
MKTAITRAVLGIFLLGFASNLSAQDNSTDSTKQYQKRTFRTWSIGLNTGILTHYTPFNNKINGDFKTPESDWGYGGYIKKQILPGFGLQADFLAGEVKGKRSNYLPDNSDVQDQSAFRTHIDWSGSISANFTIANVGLNHKRSFISPYFTAGVGYMSSSPHVFNTPAGVNSQFGQKWFLPVGAGFKLNLTDMLNLDLGYRVYFLKSNNFDGVANSYDDKFSYIHAGVEIALGKKKSPQLQNFSAVAALREASAAQAAAYRNQMNALQMQQAEKDRQYAKDLGDDDGDGVANKFDKCPGTPKDTVVDGSGCPLKVPAPIVMAPQVTEKITVTEEDRRVVGEAIKNLEFDLGKSTIKETSFASLDKVAELLVKKNFTLKLAGHTDNIGSPKANMKLSKDRAESVKAYLVKQGANSSRIEATGYGAEQPIESNKTAAGRQKNRRVEFTLF